MPVFISKFKKKLNKFVIRKIQLLMPFFLNFNIFFAKIALLKKS